MSIQLKLEQIDMRNLLNELRIISVAVMLIIPFVGSSQTVTHVAARQEGQELVISYTLSTTEPCEVSLHISTDRGRTWQGPLGNCIGDVGKNISSGNRQIRWVVLEDREQLVGEGIQFKVVASGRKAFEPEMVFVEGGRFMMGSNSGETDERPVHEVELSSFYIGKYEVTQAQWEAVMGSNPSHFGPCGSCPVESVVFSLEMMYNRFGGADVFGSYNDFGDLLLEDRNYRIDVFHGLGGQEVFEVDFYEFERIVQSAVDTYIRRLNSLTGKSYRLPTEAEWEYVARGGQRSRGTIYSGSTDIGSVGWYNGNSGGITHPVGQKIPNELGIYDISGNVWEWCADWYSNYASSFKYNPCGPTSGLYRVLRGGSWFDDPLNCRVSERYRGISDLRDSHIGFRLVLPSAQ